MQILLAVLVASTVAQGTPAAVMQAAEKDLSAAVAKRDIASIVQLYADEAEMVPPDQDPAKGKPAIENLWRGAFDAGLASFELKPDAVDVDGNTAHEKGTYTMKLASGETFQRGKYQIAWKRDGSSWRMLRNEWTIDP